MDIFDKINHSLKDLDKDINIIRTQLLSIKGYVRILERSEDDRQPAGIPSVKQESISQSERDWEQYNAL